MNKNIYNWYCPSCGKKHSEEIEIPEAPNMIETDIQCTNCSKKWNLIASTCNHCHEGNAEYFGKISFINVIKSQVIYREQLVKNIGNILKENNIQIKLEETPEYMRRKEICENCGKEFIFAFKVYK